MPSLSFSTRVFQLTVDPWSASFFLIFSFSSLVNKSFLIDSWNSTCSQYLFLITNFFSSLRQFFQSSLLPLSFFHFCKIIRFAPAMVNQAHRTRPSADMETQFSTCWQNCTPLPTAQKTFVKFSWSVFMTTALTWKTTPMETATPRSAVLFFKRCARTWPNARLSIELLEVVGNGIALRKCYDKASDMLSCQMVTLASRLLSCMR